MAGIPYKLPNERNPYMVPGVQDATFGTLTAESSNARTQSIVIRDDNGAPVTKPTLVTVWLADAANGIGVAATAASGGIAAGTNGKLMATLVAGKMATFQTDASGNLDVAITDAGTRTLHLVVGKQDGTIIASTPVAFA